MTVLTELPTGGALPAASSPEDQAALAQGMAEALAALGMSFDEQPSPDSSTASEPDPGQEAAAPASDPAEADRTTSPAAEAAGGGGVQEDRPAPTVADQEQSAGENDPAARIAKLEHDIRSLQGRLRAQSAKGVPLGGDILDEADKAKIAALGEIFPEVGEALDVLMKKMQQRIAAIEAPLLEARQAQGEDEWQQVVNQHSAWFDPTKPLAQHEGFQEWVTQQRGATKLALNALQEQHAKNAVDIDLLADVMRQFALDRGHELSAGTEPPTPTTKASPATKRLAAHMPIRTRGPGARAGRSEDLSEQAQLEMGKQDALRAMGML